MVKEKIVLCFSYCKSMRHDDPRGVANLTPWDMIGRIYVGYHQTLLHTKNHALGLVVSDKEIILRFPIVSLWEMMTPGLGQFRPKGRDWKDLCWVPLNIATHKILKLLTSEKKIFYIFLL